MMQIIFCDTTTPDHSLPAVVELLQLAINYVWRLFSLKNVSFQFKQYLSYKWSTFSITSALARIWSKLYTAPSYGIKQMFNLSDYIFFLLFTEQHISLWSGFTKRAFLLLSGTLSCKGIKKVTTNQWYLILGDIYVLFLSSLLRKDTSNWFKGRAGVI